MTDIDNQNSIIQFLQVELTNARQEQEKVKKQLRGIKNAMQQLHSKIYCEKKKLLELQNQIIKDEEYQKLIELEKEELHNKLIREEEERLAEHEKQREEEEPEMVILDEEILNKEFEHEEIFDRQVSNEQVFVHEEVLNQKEVVQELTEQERLIELEIEKEFDRQKLFDEDPKQKYLDILKQHKLRELELEKEFEKEKARIALLIEEAYQEWGNEDDAHNIIRIS